MRLQRIFALMMCVLFSTITGANENVLIGTAVGKTTVAERDRPWYYPFEIGELRIKQSNDGTGIIKNVSCLGCEYQFVKITANTEVIVNGKKVGLLRARERAGQTAYIEFDRNTAVVKYMYWAE